MIGLRPAFVRALRGIVGEGALLTSAESRLVYECDMNTLHKAAPDVVVLPTRAEQVLAVVRLCLESGVAIVPRGSGTGLIGGVAAPNGGVVIAMNRMRRVLEVDLANRCATVEPGLINTELTNHVKKDGWSFAPDPSSQSASSIGGNVSTNAGGPHCLKYGVTVQHVLGVQVVTGGGEMVSLGGKTADPLGYDLAGLLVGSEGTLGLITAVTVRLVRHPEAVRTALASFKTIEAASEAVSAIIRKGIVPAALEMLDDVIIEAVERYDPAGYPKETGAVLLIELDGPAAEVEADASACVLLCERAGATAIKVAKNDAERAVLWRGRKAAAAVFGQIAPSWLLQDVVVPRSKLPEMMRRIVEIRRRYDLVIANVFHAGDGNLHPVICYDEHAPGALERAIAANEEILSACLALGGSVSGEHGIGMDKAKSLLREFAAADLDFMARLRNVFDPKRLMNPGKLLPTGSRCGEAHVPRRAIPTGTWV